MAAEEHLRHLVEAQGFQWKLIEDFKCSISPFTCTDPSVTIYSIPTTLREVQVEAYEARLNHFTIDVQVNATYERSELKGRHDMCHVHSILSRNPDNRFEDYVVAMNELRDRIRRCYVTDVELDIRRLIFAVAHGCFIVDLLLLFYERRLTTDRKCTSLLTLLWVDMLLVENQIPFFVLQRIFDMAVVDKSQFPTFLEIAVHFFEQFVDLNKQRPPMESNAVHHLLHLVHSHLLPINIPKPCPSDKPHNLIKFTTNKLKNLLSRNPSQQLPITNSNPPSKPFLIRPIPSARRLLEAGIKSKRKELNGFSDITFKRGVLEIPRLWVDSNTKILLRNLIAWEQCYPISGAYFTSYAIFMDYIVNSINDAEILGQAGIVEQSSGGYEEVAVVFNGLSTNVVYTGKEDGFLPQLCQELNEYCGNKFNLWWAKLTREYFGNPWSIISLVAAFILIMLTTTQTFYSVYAYAHPPKQN